MAGRGQVGCPGHTSSDFGLPDELKQLLNFYPNRALLQAVASGGGWPDAIQPVMIWAVAGS
jgi:hypothetical protein